MRHDIYQLTEILKQQNFKPNNFIEIGSRDGHDTNYISHYWNIKHENCYIIEAHPGCFDFITKTYPHFNTLNIAASNETQPIVFNAGIIGKESNIGVSSVLNRTLDEFICEPVHIDAWKMYDVMQHFNIDTFDFMKIDVEGFGLEVLQGFGEKIKNTSYIQIELEVKQVWANQSYYDDVIDFLNTQGFSVLHDVNLDDVQHDVLFKNNNL